MRAFVTVLGQDRVGIIYRITSVFAETNVNVLDVNQTLLGGSFTMMMLVDLSNAKGDFKFIKEALDKVGKEMELSVKIQREDIFNAMHDV